MAHRRGGPVTHEFAPAVQLALLRIDGTEAPGGLGSEWWRPVRWCRADYFGDPARPLAECVRDRVEEVLGRRPSGPVQMLGHVRLLGHCFNPLTVYVCHEGDAVDAFVLDVCNTPWGEHHAYVFPAVDDVQHADKVLHVSPFLPMDVRYAVRLEAPAESVRLTVRVGEGAPPLLETHLSAQRVATPAGVERTLLQRPLSTWAVTAGIHWQALRLWARGAAFHPHPRRADTGGEAPVSPVTPRQRLPRWANGGSRALLLGLLDRGRGGVVTVVEARGRRAVGRAGASELAAEVHVHDTDTWRSVVGRGAIGLGAAYFDGRWDAASGEDLVDLLRIVIRDIGPLDRLRNRLQRVGAPVTEPVRRRQANDPARQRRDVRAHYDLGDDLFRTFLDESLMYSSAIFSHAAATLEEASQCKLQRVVSQLDLQPTDRVLEIGSGWGGFALYAAGHTGCHVTTTTVSRRQHAYVTEQVRRAGLADRVTVLDQDYRDLGGTFDKLVSIEMIEAVDWRDHDLFFGTCADRLRPGGLMLLQAILIADDRFERAKNTHEFMREFIFPGGCLPSAASVQRCLDTAGLRAVDWFETGPHYVRTLREWRHRFDAAAPELARLGYDRRFRRMWRFYLAYCEAAFAEGHVHGTQLLAGKPA